MEQQVSYTAVLERQPGGNYIASVSELPGCVTQGDSRDEAVTNIREALSLYVEDCFAAGDLFTKRKSLKVVEIENPGPASGFVLNHPSPELRGSLERAGFVFRAEKGNHLIFRRDHPHYSRVVIMKGLDRDAIDAYWNSLNGGEQIRIEADLLAKTSEVLRTRYQQAQTEGGRSFDLVRRELIDEYVQRVARAATRNHSGV